MAAHSSKEQWLDHDSEADRAARLARIVWLAENLPERDVERFSNDHISQDLLLEMRVCFVYGQYLAVVILGLNLVEQLLTGLYYKSGRSELRHAGLAILLQEAKQESWITQDLYTHLERARRIHYVVTHPRKPTEGEPGKRSMTIPRDVPPAIANDTAQYVIITTLHLYKRLADYKD